MKIGVPRETKILEFRVSMVPAGVKEAVRRGHEVVVQSQAAGVIGILDDDFRAAGATIVSSAAEVFSAADMIVKVKEPQPEECAMLRPGQILFAYLHLAPDAALTERLRQSGVTAIAYETVTDEHGRLPLLAPMSEVAGRLAPQMGAYALQCANGGRGMLLAGVPGVAPADVLVIGGGVVGESAARIALGMGANVVVADTSARRMRELDGRYGPCLKTLSASAGDLDDAVVEADLVIGAVLIPGAEAPKLVSRSTLSRMRKGAAIVDVAIDQGGCFETSRATTHADPVYTVDGIVHYCVANMPGAVARTATLALTNATLPSVLQLADQGWNAAIRVDKGLRDGLNIHAGEIYHPAVAAVRGTAPPPLEALM
jgi:alanine dehydrogenase